MESRGPQSTEARVRRANADDAAGVSAVLARAFATNPFIRWIVPSEVMYARSGDEFFRIAVDRELDEGEIYIDDACSGAALWLPPGFAAPGLLAQLRVGFRLLRSLRSRTLVAAAALDKFERARPGQPHWYLTVLGTDPARQGRGVGGALMGPILERCDATGTAAYLESSNPHNVGYYQRFGFRVTGEIAFKGGPTVPLMLRDPQ